MIFAAPASTPRLLSCLGALSLGLAIHAGAQAINPLDEDEEVEEGLPAMQMLIEGSVLKGVMMPQYDASKRLTSVMRAAKLTLVNKGLIRADTLRVEFFNPDRSPKGRIDLATATLEDQSILRSTDPVSLVSDELNLNGTGLVYELRASRGFLNGPAHASTLIDTRTSMKSTPKQRSIIAGTMIAAAASAPGGGLKELDEEQQTGLDRLAASSQVEASAAKEAVDKSIESSELQSREADKAVDTFLRKTEISKSAEKDAGLDSQVPGPEGLTIREPATFSAEDGIYFDSEKGLLVFLKNVEANHPDFTLTGADEVKVFLEKEKSKSPKDEAPRSIDEEEAGELLGGAKFGDPSMIIATGTVLVEKIKTKPGDKGAKASGRQMIFDFKSNELIIRGGQPWIISDNARIRVLDPKGYIRINVESGETSVVGRSTGLASTEASTQDADFEPFTPMDLKQTDFRTEIDPNLPTVLTLGDSISIGYTLPLREALEGKFNVIRPMRSKGRPLNTGNSSLFLNKIEEYLPASSPDVIIFNSGMWDIIHRDPKTPEVTDIDEKAYRDNLNKIITRLKKTKARLIWANTTFVPEDNLGHIDTMAVRYNRIAEEVMKENQIPVVDLHTVSKEFEVQNRWFPTDVHFTPEGSKKLATVLAEAVLKPNN